jgi:flagellar biosynthesis/type III secretory pathway protein FliH
MSRSARPLARFIPAEEVKAAQVAAFTYRPIDPELAMMAEAGDVDDEPIGSQLSSAEEDAARLASVDQIIYERMQEAERKASEIEQSAFERGFQAGEAEGRAFGESQYRTYIQRLEGELKELAEVTAQVKDQADEQMLALCIAMGEHLAAQQIERGRDSIRALVDRVLENLPFPVPRTRETGEKPLIVHLNPHDLEMLGDHYVGHLGLRLVEDPSLSRGSLSLEAEDGVLDATLERRRQRLMELMGRLLEG